MSNPTKRSRKSSRVTVDRSASTDVVTQLECAIRHPHAALIGALIGGVVPWFGRTLAHSEIPAVLSAGNSGLAMLLIAIVLGCACFSALSVFKFGKAAFHDSRKAIGFVVALEGVMLVAHGVTSAVALAVVVAINALSNGSVIALRRDAARRQCDADARRAATRARNQAARADSSRPLPVMPSFARPARPAHVPSIALVGPAWRQPSFEDVLDAEVVSEERAFS